VWTRSTAHGLWAVPVHDGPWTGPRQWLARGRSERCPDARNLAMTKEKGGGDGGEEMMEEALSVGGAWAQRE
jgi:hypothetical protein